MGLETFTHINALVATNPIGASDPKSQGDDHIRGIKIVLLADFPNIGGAVTLSHTQINSAAIKSEANVFTAAAQTIQAAEARWVATDGAINATVQASTGNTGGVIGTLSNHQCGFYTNSTRRMNIAANGDTNLGINGGPVTINSGFDLRNLAGGTYTPSAFNAINCGLTPNKHFYTRAGNVVTVSGSSSINITTGAGTSTSVEISLPVASNFTASTDLAGNGSNDDTGFETIRLNANTGNDRAQIFFSANSVGLGTLFYTFSYEVK